jgi:hypothetical protein
MSSSIGFAPSGDFSFKWGHSRPSQVAGGEDKKLPRFCGISQFMPTRHAALIEEIRAKTLEDGRTQQQWSHPNSR